MTNGEWRGPRLCAERAWLVREDSKEDNLPGKKTTEKKEEMKKTRVLRCYQLYADEDIFVMYKYINGVFGFWTLKFFGI